MGKIVTGPYTVPVGQTDMLSLPRSQPQSTLSSVYETQVFQDALPHDICDIQVLDLRTSPTMFFVTAHDDTNNRIAFASADISFSRAAGGALSLFAINGSGGFNPNIAPWFNITATAVVIGTEHCAIRVQAPLLLAGVAIRWSGWIGIPGAQARA
jgi:hypothetical protein